MSEVLAQLEKKGGGSGAFEMLTQANMTSTYTFTKSIKKALLVCFSNTDGGRSPSFTITTSINRTQIGNDLRTSGNYFRHVFAAYELNDIQSGNTITVASPANVEGVYGIYEVE